MAHKSDSHTDTLRGILFGIVLTCVATSVFLAFTESSQDNFDSMRTARSLHSKTLYEEMKDEAEASISMTRLETAVVCIVTLLIAATISFEHAKETIEESASRNLKPVVESLFGEMTILGFLSACTFCITKTPLPYKLSERLFGEEELLVEIFETVHFSLFFVMIFFVAQVLLLVRQSIRTEKKWSHFDHLCRQSSHEIPYDDPDLDLDLFRRLAKEFVLERSVEPPFVPATQRLPDGFRFGRYLSICLGSNMAHVVHVSMRCWTFFLVVTFCFYLVMRLLRNDLVVIAWVWVGMGWVVLLLTWFFERYIRGIMEAFAAPKPASRTIGSNGTSSESDQLLESMPVWTQLPNWCHIDLEEYVEKRNMCLRHCCDEEPSRQDAWFLFEREGHEVHFLFLQIVFVFLGIYGTLFLVTFVPDVWEAYHHNTPLFIGYLVLSVIPIALIQIRSRDMLAMTSIVGCIGVHGRRPQIVADVLREDKTARVVRAFVVLDKMNRMARARQNHAPTRSHEHTRATSPHLDSVELEEVAKTFDALDASGDGSISPSEVQRLLYGAGQPLNEERLESMVQALDTNSDGRISKEEFLSWYQQNVLGATHHQEVSMKQRAEALFRMFDTNNSGKISVGEFKTTLDKFSVGFTVDEVGDIVRELDEDGNVKIGVHEFEELLEKYYPMELEHEE